MKRYKIEIEIIYDNKFFAITPAFNINLNSSEFEIEWLFLGIYFKKITNNNKLENINYNTGKIIINNKNFDI
jgi:hypothetical protein